MKKIMLTILSLVCFERMARADGHDEKILGYQPTKEGIIFHVNSGGCTKLQDFIIDMNRDQTSQTASVKLVRVNPDNCHSYVATGTKITFTYDQIGIAPNEAFEIQNQNGVVRGWAWKDAD